MEPFLTPIYFGIIGWNLLHQIRLWYTIIILPILGLNIQLGTV